MAILGVLNGDNCLVAVFCTNRCHTPTTLTPEQAKDKSEIWVDSIFEGIGSQKISNMPSQVSPIVMAKVDLNGGFESETPVAYSVRYDNAFDGVRILGSYYSTIIDDGGVNYSSINWSDFKEVKTKTKTNTISFNNAVKKVSEKVSVRLKGIEKTMSVDSKKSTVVNNAELVFDFNISTGTYQPTWIFNMGDDTKYKVNCFEGNVITVE